MKNRGFTLLELLVTIALAAILLAVAAPSFTNIIRNNALGSARNDLYGAIQYARAEAVSRNVDVSICAAANVNLNECADTGNASWSDNGWIVFVDTGAGGTIGNASILRVQQAIEQMNVYYSNSTNDNYLRYLPSGLLDTDIDGGIFSICDPDNNDNARAILVTDASGQARTGSSDDASCTAPST